MDFSAGFQRCCRQPPENQSAVRLFVRPMWLASEALIRVGTKVQFRKNFKIS